MQKIWEASRICLAWKKVYLILFLALAACSPSTPQESSLDLEISGLPSGTEGLIQITNTDGFSQSIGSSQRLEHLKAGSYTLVAQDVSQADLYIPDKRQQIVLLKEGETQNARVVYIKQEKALGSLELTIAGLPLGTQAKVNVTGPNNFNVQLSASSVLSNLVPGDYSLRAESVENYDPTPANQTFSLKAGEKTVFTVTYSSQAPTAGQLNIDILGLPSTDNALIVVSGPDGFNQLVEHSSTLKNLKPGDYKVEARAIESTYTYNPQPKSQSVTITSGTTSESPVAYVPTILAIDGTEKDNFGQAVATNGEWLAVGAPNATLARIELDRPGAVYMYHYSDTGAWEFVKEIFPQNLSSNATFGRSLAMLGDRLVVGAPLHDYDANNNKILECNRDTYMECDLGAAYIFERNQGGPDAWGEVAELLAKDANVRSAFGVSVALDGDTPETSTIVVGAPSHAVDANADGKLNCDEFGNKGSECTLGAAYVFRLEPAKEGVLSWRLVSLLSSDNPARYDAFGGSVAVSKDTIVVGSPYSAFDVNDDGTIACTEADQSECKQGIAFMFQRDAKGENTYGLASKLVSSDKDSSDFAMQLVMNETNLVASFSKVKPEQIDSFAEVFELPITVPLAPSKKIIQVDDDSEGNPNVFTTLALSGDSLMIGTPYAAYDLNDDGTLDCHATAEEGNYGDECAIGFAHLFKRNEGGANMWGKVRQFTASDITQSNHFGQSLALYENTFIVSAPQYKHPVKKDSLGAVYSYVVTGPK